MNIHIFTTISLFKIYKLIYYYQHSVPFLKYTIIPIFTSKNIPKLSQQHKHPHLSASLKVCATSQSQITVQDEKTSTVGNSYYL